MPLLQNCWRSLPPRTRELLCIGSLGQQHLQTAARTAKAEGHAALTAELLLAAWEHNPLNGPCAAAAMQAGACPEALSPLLRSIASQWQAPPAGGEYQQLVKAGRLGQAYDAVKKALASTGGLFWAEQALALGILLGKDLESIELAKASLPQADFAPLAHYLEAERLLLEHAWQSAQERYARLAESPATADWLLPQERLAECLLRLGRSDAAREVWRELLRKRPWHASLVLRVHGEIVPLEPAGHLPPTAVLLYTWNKAEYLDGVLEALAGSRGIERIAVVDNGSTDATSQVLHSWLERLGNESMEVHTLPVNIGAPAARNWLAALPCLEQMECAVYLDDDALPPPDWLELLHAARQARPDATAWGCCVVDHDAPQVVQSADFHIIPGPAQGDGNFQCFELQSLNAAPFHFSTLQSQTPLRGQFQYLRPCISVTGCCHLLHVQELREGGGFDLRFTPTQYDDAERDLRRAVAGKHCVYQGFLTVRHHKPSGKGAAMSRQAMGNWRANHYKLMHRFETQDLQKLWERQNALLLEDLLERLPELEQSLGLG